MNNLLLPGAPCEFCNHEGEIHTPEGCSHTFQTGGFCSCQRTCILPLPMFPGGLEFHKKKEGE